MDEYFIEEKTGSDRFIDFLVFLAVFVVTIFLLLEVGANAKIGSLNLANINHIYYYVSMVVFTIFVVDLVRLYRESKDFKTFLKGNWLDIFATIPFGLLAGGASFEILKLAKLEKLTKLSKVAKLNKASKISKISKEFKAASHLKKESAEYQRKHRL